METAMQKKVTWNKEKIVKYLTLYLGQPTLGSWESHMDEYYRRKKYQFGEEKALIALHKSIAFACMYVYKEKGRLPHPKQSILFTGEKWSQFNDADWVALFEKIHEEDEHIQKWRNQVLSLGIVYPIEYSPITRQAFNWLYDKAEASGIVTEFNKSDIVDKYKRLVFVYGGTVICNIFAKSESRVNREVINWETNYFFERLIYQMYSIDQIVKIKKQELQKTNPKLVKKV